MTSGVREQRRYLLTRLKPTELIYHRNKFLVYFSTSMCGIYFYRYAYNNNYQLATPLYIIIH